MVCVADEPRVQCIVRDITHGSSKQKFEVTLPASTMVHELISQVATSMNYEPNSFQLMLQTRENDKVFTESTIGSLEDLGFNTEPGSRNALMLQKIKCGPEANLRLKTDMSGRGENEVDMSVRDDVTSTTSHPPVYPLPPPPSTLLPPASSPAGDYNYSSPIIRHDTGYVGLVNQAMTCYLNSLLQALFMTPEFRNALYKWKFDSGHNTNASKCIPFQLQKLFLNLQTSHKTAVETTELTKSFGWESGEVWQQHDIQELCRVMFDALEQEFKETEQADLINQLYQGKMIDYVKCLECGREKSREDTFLDIPLPVRPFGSTVAYENIQEALSAFVQPETLDGNNQYFCESCNKKCDAHKGLKFVKFPYLLTLHLKRFDFDYSTMHRIKLNDKVSFPEELDLNSFVRWTTGAEEEEEDGSPVRGDDSSTADSALDEETTHTIEPQTIEPDQDEDEGIDMSTSSGNHIENEKNRQQDLNKGPFVYQLYSIMIHSGSASGGHYYAYIKDFAKDEWFCFNDQSVTRITQSDIIKTYGGGPTRGYYSGAYSSSTNAYMLMYRQIDKERNASAITEKHFPPHITKLLDEIKESEENERAMRARQEEMVKLKVYTGPNISSLNQTKFYVHNDTPLIEVMHMAYSNLQLEGIVPEEQCRLVSYSHSQGQMEVSFEGREAESISEILSSLRNSSNYEFYLETREKNQCFTPYSSGDINLTVYIVDPELEDVLSVHNLRTTPCQNLTELREFLCRVTSLQTQDVYVFLDKYPALTFVTEESQRLNKLGFYSTNRVFVCLKDLEPDIDTNNYETSKLYKFVAKVHNIIILRIILPDSSQDTLERLLIPPLNDVKLNGNNNRQCNVTPTGDKEMALPMANGLEEEGVCGGAGGTSDQSTSEDSSLTDSERTIIGEVPNEAQLSSPSDSDQHLSSPEGHQPVKISEMNGDGEENWDEEDELINKTYYFKATPYTADGATKMLRIVVDRQIDMSSFKGKLEPYVGVAAKYMKLYRGPDIERGELTNSFSNYKDEERISVKLHRVLSEGEHRVKLNLLSINSPNPVQPICEWIVSRGATIASTKKAILKELEKRLNVKVPYERCRLWKKNWKSQSPGQVLIESHTWDEELCVGSQKEIFVQEMEAEGDGVVVFTRHWHPSTLTIDPFREIVFSGTSITDFRNKISEMSGIPTENVKFAKGVSPFPCDMSVLNIHNELDWDQTTDYFLDVKLGYSEDGIVIFYRDDRETLKPLTKEEQQEVSNRESARLSTSTNNFSNYSPRKEKALKIYLDNSPRQTRAYIDID